MASNLLTTLSSLLVVYWLHSTVLIGAVWVLLKRYPDLPHAIAERLWKVAAIGGFITTGLQAATGCGIPMLTMSSVEDRVSTTSLLVADSATALPGSAASWSAEDDESPTRPSIDQSLGLLRSSAREFAATLSGADRPGDSTAAAASDKAATRTPEVQSTGSVANVTGTLRRTLLGEVTMGPTRSVRSDGSDQSGRQADRADRRTTQHDFATGEHQVASSRLENAHRTTDAASAVRSTSDATNSPSHNGASSGILSRMTVPVRSLLRVLSVTLVAFTTVGFALFAVRWMSFVWQTQELDAAEPELQAQFDQLCHRLGVARRIRLHVSDQFGEPVAFGLLHWQIIVPPRMLERLEPRELESLLSHEIAHLVRGDVFWLHLGRLLTTGFAWQPLNLIARRQWQLCAEFQCDDWAVRHAADPLSLARSLATVAEWRTSRHRRVIALPASGSGHLTQRVERLLVPASEDSPRHRTTVCLAAVLLTMTATLVLAGPTLQHRSTGESNFVRTSDDEPSAATDQQQPHGTDNPPLPVSVSDTSDSDELDQEAAALALELAELRDELAALAPLIEQASHDPALNNSKLHKVVQRLQSRLSRLSGEAAMSADQPSRSAEQRSVIGQGASS